MKNTLKILEWFQGLSDRYTQRELAEMAGLVQPTVTRLMRGDIGINLRTFMKIEDLWLARGQLRRRGKAQKKGE